MRASVLISFILGLVLGLNVLGGAAENTVRATKDGENLYSSFGKRDPFRVPEHGGLGKSGQLVNPLRKYRLEGYKLRAVLRIAGSPQAMFEDPEGRSHVVVEGDILGMEGARISRIVNSEVIVTERSSDYLGRETLLEKVIGLPSEREVGSSALEGVQQGFSDSSKPKVAVPLNETKPKGEP